MTDSEFVEAVRDDEATALRRLGSDKYLVAATDADLATPAVLRTVVATAESGRDTFVTWADSADDPAASTFAEAAETEADHHDRVAAVLDERGVDSPAAEPGDAVHRALQSADDAVERAGAMVGRGLVADRTRLQVVNFFVNEGNSDLADTARELRSDATDQVDAGAALLAEICEDDSDRDRAHDAATTVIAAAYDEYAESLESMGVDPKPVC